jgi:hypothetical protein
MDNQNRTNEIIFFNKVKNFFKKKPTVNKNQLGVYHDVWSMATSNESLHTIRYDIFVKVKAVEVYDDLIEVTVEDLQVSESVNQDILNIIRSTIPKYVVPKNVKWTV